MSPIQWRRLSGEIQYWRNSIIENPLPEPSGLRSETYNNPESERAHFRNIAPSPSSLHRPTLRDSLKHLRSGSFANMGSQTATVEQRLTTLEIKFIDHEYAIAELQGCNFRTSTKMLKRRSVQDIFPDINEQRASTSSNNHGHTFLSSPADSPTPADSFDHSARQYRSSNAPTLRPIISIGSSPPVDSYPLSSSNLMTKEQFDSLMALMATERAARRDLEERVAELQAQVEELRNASYIPRRPIAYPTPSPESRHSTLAVRGQANRRPTCG
jgi:hypothetical protein